MPQIDLNESHEEIFINDHAGLEDDSIQQQTHIKLLNEEALNQVAKFEIFESSSDDELSQGAFESAAHSYQKRQDRL